MAQRRPAPVSPTLLDRAEPHQDGPLSERRIDEVLSHVVHEVYVAGLDLHTVLGLLNGHRSLAEDRVNAVITRLDGVISTIHRAGARLVLARTAATIDALVALPDGIGLSGSLDTLIRLCVELLDLAAAAIVLSDQGATAEVSAAGEGAATARELCRLDEGPCHDIGETRRHVTMADPSATGRWPLFTARARTAGFQAVHTLPLNCAGTQLGALAMFSTSARELSDEDVRIAKGAADFAAVAVTCDGVLRQRDSLVEQLQVALVDQAVVEQAKGILAERHGIPVSAAQSAMTTHSRLHDGRLVDTAQAIVDGTADLAETVRRLR